MNISRRLLILLVWATGGCWSAPPPDGSLRALIVFGDSLSDVGNISAESAIVPQLPYHNGRFSNGDIWVELFARHFGLEARPSYLGGTNYAQGASGTGRGLANYGGLPLGPNVREQVLLYRGRPLGTELFIVWGGANDVFDVLAGACEMTPAQMADNVYLAVAMLYERGGRQFLVPNLPDIGLAPRYRDGERASMATQLSGDFNAHLAARLDQLDSLSGIRIYRLDVWALFNAAIADPPPGVTNLTEPAWSGSFLGYLSGGELVADPDAYLFWDSVHPTRVSHGLIAAAAIDLVESSFAPPVQRPEPVGLSGIALPPPIDFWLTYFSLLSQPSDAPDECRY